MRLNQLIKWVMAHKKKSALFAVPVFLLLIMGISLFIFQNHKKDGKFANATTVDINSSVKTTINSNTTIDPNDADTTMKWVKSAHVSDNSLSIDGTIEEEIDENQLFVGNLSLPQGWTVQYSLSSHGTPKGSRVFSNYDLANQSNYQIEFLNLINYLKINTGSADSVKPFANSPLVKPMDTQKFITNGDKPSQPILFNGKVFMIMVAQRATVTANTIDCFDLLTYSRCEVNGNASFFPTYLSSTGASATTPTALGQGTRDITTPSTMQFVMDDGTYGHNGRLYMPAQVGTNYGVNCVDLSTYRNCGFTSLGSAAVPTGPNPSWLVGFVQNGSKIYGHANDPDIGNQTVVCFDIRDLGNGGGLCPGYTASTTATTQTTYSYEHGDDYDTSGSMIMDGTKMYWTVDYRLANSRLFDLVPNEEQQIPAAYNFGFYPTQRFLGMIFTCFDVSTNAKCSGVYNYNWPRWYDASVGVDTVGMAFSGPMFILRDNDSIIGGTASKAICYVVGGIERNSSHNTRTECNQTSNGERMSDSGIPGPYITPAVSEWQGVWVFGQPYWRPGPQMTTITDGTDGHVKSYTGFQYNTFGDPTSTTRGAMTCYDWTTQAVCAGIPNIKYLYDMDDGNAAVQGFVYDGSCMTGVTKNGSIWSFNPTTTESPCRVARTKYTASIDTTKFYCDGQSHPFTWQSVGLAKSNMYDFENFGVKVYGSQGGAQQATGNIKANGSLDISGINSTTFNSLFIDVDANVWNTSPWANGGQPYATVRANGDDVQYCYNTRAKTYAENIACDVNSLKTISGAVFNSDDNTFAKTTTSQIGFTQRPDKQCFKDLAVSVSNNKNLINNGDTVTYTINVQNLANTDPSNRGDIGGILNPKRARIEATIPAGMIYVSSSIFGTLSGDQTKVIWDNQSVLAGTTISPTVTLRAPGAIASSQPKPDIVYAAKTQTNLVMQATAIYDDDVAQSNNSDSNNAVTFENNQSPVITNLAQTVSSPRAPTSLHFTVNASDDSDIDSVVLLDNNGDSLGAMTPTATANQYEITVTNYNVAGAYSFTAKATDDGTPTLSATTEPLITNVAAANIAPVVTNFTQTNSNLRAPAQMHFTVTATDDTAIASVVLQDSNGTNLSTMSPTGVANQYAVDLNGLGAGSYSFTARATDNDNPAGTTVSSSIIVNVAANTAPVVTNFVQTNTNLRNPATLNFTVTATDDAQIATLQLLENNNVVGTMTPTGTANQYGVTLNNIAAGSYSYKAKAIDNGTPALNTESSVINLSVAANAAPVVSGLSQSVTSPRDPASLTFTVTGTDDDQIVTMELIEGNNVVGTMTPTGTANQFGVTINNVNAGYHSYRARATDSGTPVRTATTSNIEVVVLPNLSPVVTNLVQSIASPRAPATLNFTVTATDDKQVTKVELYEGSNMLGTMTPTGTANQYAVALYNFTAGNHTFYAKATDNGSPSLKTDSMSITFNILPNIPPTIGTLTQSTASPRAPATLSFSVTASDEGSISSVKLLSGETVVGTMNSVGSDQYSLTINNYTAGPYTFTAVAADNANPALTTFSAPISLTVDPALPVNPPPANPPNESPKISSFAQTVNNPVAPADLNFTVNATDDGSISKAEVLDDRGEVLGAMSATTTPNQFALTLTNYQAGYYEFVIRITDNSNPAKTTLSEVIGVTVAAASISGGGRSQNVDNSNKSYTYTPVAIRENIPEAFKGAVEGVFKAADSVARPVSPNTAKALPYTTISLLIGFIGLYSFLAIKQTQTRNKLKKILERFKRTEANRKSYLDLTSHYLNTPIATMQSSVELFESQKSLTPESVSFAKKRIQRLADDVHNLLDTSKSMTQESQKATVVMSQASTLNILKSPGFIIPVVGVFVSALIFNLLFVWAKKYDSNVINYIVQTSLYILAAAGLGASYSFMKREQLATVAINEEFNLEKSITDSQSSFIRSSSSQLSEDLNNIMSVAPAIQKVPHGKTFTDGLASLDKAVNKLSYLDSLTSASTVTASPISLDISLKSIVDKFVDAAHAKKIKLNISASPGLIGAIDEAGFQQIMGSLLDNAVKFTPEGGSIDIMAQTSGKKTTIVVKDTGIGIPRTKIDQLFTPFSRATDTLEYNYDGMGIDLYMDKLIVDRWDGNIDIKSKEGAGTEITVSLNTVN